MNEITKIHLGRQPFTISVDAYKTLEEYLRAIKRRMGDTDEAMEEVEARMAELLTERGISGDKVVLPKDVAYLKEQLGEPGDFGEGAAEEVPQESVAVPKRLFRDTENAMIAGVAAGLGKYFGIDPVWVRLAFIALVFAGASGILLYIILWLIVPEAKTASERLQMQGKPVTIEALKEVVERADVKGAAERATNTVGKAVNTVLKVLLAIVGVAVITGAIAMLAAVVAAGIYLLLNGTTVNGIVVFPIGALEVVALVSILLFVALTALFVLAAGMALVTRRWPLPGWAVGALIVLLVASGSAGTALSFDAAPRVSDRVKSAQQSPSDHCDEGYIHVFNLCYREENGDIEIESSHRLRR
ncbi:PspC domain-containing protein [Candidatus Saccharibacteria bacterium]|nr:PspC domain-containing protein [Candidatus Saccharibacteria bacterium]